MPASYFSGSAKFKGNYASNIVISNSTILASSLDMNEGAITSVRNPVQGQDAATKSYVDSQLEKVAQPYQEIQVVLGDDKYTDIALVNPGSYLVSIASATDGAPTAVFAISKSSKDMTTGHVYRLTATPGLVTGEQLDVVWPANEKLKLRKSGLGYNGLYIVNFNTKNATVVPFANQTLPTVVTVPESHVRTGLWSMSFTVMNQWNLGAPLDSVSGLVSGVPPSGKRIDDGSGDPSDSGPSGPLLLEEEENKKADAPPPAPVLSRSSNSFQYKFRLQQRDAVRVTTLAPGIHLVLVAYMNDASVYSGLFTIAKQIQTEGSIAPLHISSDVGLALEWTISPNGDCFVSKNNTLFDGAFLLKLL